MRTGFRERATKPVVGFSGSSLAIDLHRHTERRQAAFGLERIARRRIADPVVHAEVDVACVDVRDLVLVAERERRPVGEIVRERRGETIGVVDEDAGCDAAMGEDAGAQRVFRREEPGLRDLGADVPGRRQERIRVRAGWDLLESVVECRVEPVREQVAQPPWITSFRAPPTQL